MKTPVDFSSCMHLLCSPSNIYFFLFHKIQKNDNTGRPVKVSHFISSNAVHWVPIHTNSDTQMQAQHNSHSKLISLHINRWDRIPQCVWSRVCSSNPKIHLAKVQDIFSMWKQSVKKLSTDLRILLCLRHRRHICLAGRYWGLILHHSAHSNSAQHAVMEQKKKREKTANSKTSRRIRI